MNNKTQTHQICSIILASGSASRRQQLSDLGFTFTVQVSGIDENFFKQKKSNNHSMEEICQLIARTKVEKVAKKYPHALVLGGDQMVVLDSEIFNKTSTPEQAVQSLMKLQGNTHKLLTALYMSYKEKSFAYLEINKMQMRKLSESQVKRYVELAQPMHCAGSYALERYGIALFEKIETKDQSAVIGFPLIALINQMVKWNISLPFFDSAV